MLLQNGVNADSPNQFGNTALQAAALSGNWAKWSTKCLKMIDFYIYLGHEDIVDLLIENGANISAITKAGNTALHAATVNGNSNHSIKNQ